MNFSVVFFKQLQLKLKSFNVKKEFLTVLEKNKGVIKKIVLSFSRGIEDREDLEQEILIQLWKSFQSFRGDSKISTWIYRIALNTALMEVRKRKKSIEKEDYENYKDSLVHEETNQIEQIQLLYNAIDKLSDIEKAIIILYLDDMTYEEISDILGITVKNVGVRLVRTKRKLEVILKKMSK